MTTVEYSGVNTFGKIEEVYRVDPKNDSKKSLWNRMEENEQAIKENLQQQGYEILSIKSELISKRRYKRRIAKKLLKLKEVAY